MTYELKQDPRALKFSDYYAGHQPRVMVEEILMELSRARTKFPEQDVWITLAALTEEVGELNKALLHLNFEPAKGALPDHVYAEAVQVAVMAIRVALDCQYAPPVA